MRWTRKCPQLTAADWFGENRDYVASSVFETILGSNRALAVVEAEYLEDQYRANSRTELRDVEQVELCRGGTVFNAVLWALADLGLMPRTSVGR